MAQTKDWFPVRNNPNLDHPTNEALYLAFQRIYTLRDQVKLLAAAPAPAAAPAITVVTGGGAGGGGPTTPPTTPPPTTTGVPAAVIDGETHTLRHNDTWEVDVSFHVPGATNDNWSGVAVYIEDPDISGPKAAGTRAPSGQGPVKNPSLDGSTRLDGSANQSGVWAPLFNNDAVKSPIAIEIPTEDVIRSVRIYLASYGPNATPDLVRANDPTVTVTTTLSLPVAAGQAKNATPASMAGIVYGSWLTVGSEIVNVTNVSSTTFTATFTTAHIAGETITGNTPTPSIAVQLLPQQYVYISGMENAWLVTDQGVTVNYFLNQVPPKYSFTYAFLPPTPELEAHRPGGLGPFTGCTIKLDYGGGLDNLVYAGDQKVTADEINAQRLITWTSGEPWNLGAAFTVIVYFLSESGSQLNTPVLGVTPSVTVNVDAAAGGGGGGGVGAPDITNLQISNEMVEYQIDGSIIDIATFTWTLPTDGVIRYAGMDLYRVATTGTETCPELLRGETGSSDNSLTLEISRVPAQVETWWIAAISVDFNGQLSDDPANFSTAGPGPGFHSPYVKWVVGPPAVGVSGGGQEFAPLVTINAGATAHPNETTSSDGVRQVTFALNGTGGFWTNPSSNQFGGAWVVMVSNGDAAHPIYWHVPHGANTFTTPPMAAPGNFTLAQPIPVDFYVVSEDPQGHRNTLVVTPNPWAPPPVPTPRIVQTPTPGLLGTAYLPTEGQIIPSRFNTSWFNSTEFGWTTGNAFSVGTIGVNKIQVGTVLQVGGVGTFGSSTPQPSTNGQIGVYDNTAKAGDFLTGLVGWIGTLQGGQGTGSWSIYGAWFKQLWIGGTQPATAPLWISSYGVLVLGGIAVQTGAVYPYLSVRDQYGVEQGRIGAQLLNPSAPGDGGGVNASNLPQGVTAGAWFAQLAAGVTSTLGQPNWQIYVANGQFLINNTDLFQIDYEPNTTGVQPWNNRYFIQFGKGIWAGKGLQTSWQFPGFAIYEQGPGGEASAKLPYVFGAMYISRGIVLRGTVTYNHPVLAAFTVFNGDSAGSDQPQEFYGDMVMYSPTSPTIMTVHLQGGYATSPGGAVQGDPQFNMWDHNARGLFSVDGQGFVTCLGNIVATGAAGANVAFATGTRAAPIPVISADGHWIGQPIPTTAVGVTSLNASTSSTALTGAVILAGGSNVSLLQSGQTITISSSGPAGSQTPWTQNIDAQNNALNSVSAIRSYHMDPNSPNYAGTGFQLMDVATGNTPGLAIYQDNGIIVAGSYDSAPATGIYPANFLMINSSKTQRILLQSNLSSSDWPVMGVGFTDTAYGYVNIFAYGIQGSFAQNGGPTQVLAWEIRNGSVQAGGAGAGSPTGTLSGDLYLYKTDRTVACSILQGTITAASLSVSGAVGGASFATGNMTVIGNNGANLPWINVSTCPPAQGVVPANCIMANNYYAYGHGQNYPLEGATGTFTSADGHTITVWGGLVVLIQ